jgi:hypothetical protein
LHFGSQAEVASTAQRLESVGVAPGSGQHVGQDLRDVVQDVQQVRSLVVRGAMASTPGRSVRIDTGR